MKLPNLSPIFTWIRSVYSEPDGNGSSTRVHMAAIIGFIIGVGISFCISVHHQRVSIDQFDGFLTAAGTFILTTCGALYGINKAGSYFDAKNNPTPPEQIPPTS